MIKIPPLEFKPVLRLHEVDGSNKDGPIVRYEVLDVSLLNVVKGVYLVTLDDVIVYCGKFTNTFSRRWLYAKDRYVYHFKRSIISDAILEQRKVEVYAQAEDDLKKQLEQSGNEWISVSSIEEKLIRDLRPIWNMVGNKSRES